VCWPRLGMPGLTKLTASIGFCELSHPAAGRNALA
jgi:hypothetical protein